jgi:two-component system CheB/CheR fusion protein
MRLWILYSFAEALVALEQSSGKPSHNLLVMAKNGLAFERNIIHKTKKKKQTVIKKMYPLK